MRSTVDIFLLMALLVAVTNLGSVDSKRLETMKQVRDMSKGLRKMCAQDSGVAKELVDNALKGDFSEDPALQCYFKCLLRVTKGMKDDKLQLDVMIAQIEILLPLDVVPVVKEIMNKCYPIANSEDGCEAAWQFFKCCYEQNPEVYMLG